MYYPNGYPSDEELLENYYQRTGIRVMGRKKRSSAVFNNMDGTTIGTQVAERAIFNNPKKGKKNLKRKKSKSKK